MSWADLSDDIFERLAPHLRRCQLKSLHLVHRRFNALVKAQVTHLTPRHLSLEIPRAFPNVVHLDLSRCWNEVNDVRLIALTKIYARDASGKLKSLNLSKCHGVTNKGIAAVSQNLSRLEVLNLDGCRSSVPASYVGYTGVSGETLHGLIRLKKLHLRWNPVTDTSFQTVTKLTELTHLDLGECHGMSEASLLSLTCFRKMRVLNLDRTMVSQEAVWALAELPVLSSLSLRNCSEINDACLMLLPRLQQLMELNLAKLNNITDEGVCHLILMQKLHVLDLTYCTRLDGSWIHGCTPEDVQWQLTQLKLTDCCNWVTDDVLHDISLKMPSLEILILRNCVRISKEGLSSLRRCPLENLDLSLCYGVADQELCVLSHMKHLRELNLAFCASVSDTGLMKLQNCLHLESIVLNCCRRITAAGLRFLQPLRGTLQRLEISACHGIETDALFFISNWLDHLQVLNISWLPVNDTQFRSLKNLKHLTQVEIRGCHELTDDTLKEFWFLDGITDPQILGWEALK